MSSQSILFSVRSYCRTLALAHTLIRFHRPTPSSTILACPSPSLPPLLSSSSPPPSHRVSCADSPPPLHHRTLALRHPLILRLLPCHALIYYVPLPSSLSVPLYTIVLTRSILFRMSAPNCSRSFRRILSAIFVLSHNRTPIIVPLRLTVIRVLISFSFSLLAHHPVPSHLLAGTTSPNRFLAGFRSRPSSYRSSHALALYLYPIDSLVRIPIHFLLRPRPLPRLARISHLLPL